MPRRAPAARANDHPSRRALRRRARTASSTHPESTMTTLTAGAAPAPAPTPVPAAELAARIAVPRSLPIRYDGEPLRHLSPSSYSRFLLCPEDWRRHYLLGERTPTSGAMFLGARVDDVLTVYYRLRLERRQTITL